MVNPTHLRLRSSGGGAFPAPVPLSRSYYFLFGNGSLKLPWGVYILIILVGRYEEIVSISDLFYIFFGTEPSCCSVWRDAWSLFRNYWVVTLYCNTRFHTKWFFIYIKNQRRLRHVSILLRFGFRFCFSTFTINLVMNVSFMRMGNVMTAFWETTEKHPDQNYECGITELGKFVTGNGRRLRFFSLLQRQKRIWLKQVEEESIVVLAHVKTFNPTFPFQKH